MKDLSITIIREENLPILISNVVLLLDMGKDKSIFSVTSGRARPRVWVLLAPQLTAHTAMGKQ